MMDDPVAVEADTSIGKFRIRGTDTIAALVLVGITVMCAILYFHMEDTKRATAELAATNKEVARVLQDTNREMTGAIREGVREQRFTTCIFATKEDQREAEYMKQQSFCNRMK